MSVTGSSRAKVRRLVVAGFGLFILLGATLAVAPGAEAQEPGILEFETHQCINSDLVQSSSGASGLSVGNTFINEKYESFIIVKCEFDSSACDSSLNLYLVDDVKTCLAQSAAASPVGIASDGDGHAAPAPAAAGGGGGSMLAHTGVEHELAGAFATAIIGAGFAALGLSRARRND